MMYFRAEWKVLALITVSGLIYNLGLMAGPWFEGKMAAACADPDRDGAFSGDAPAGARLCDRDRNGAAGEIYQAVLCAPGSANNVNRAG